jgi:hypothetical protein
MQLTCSADKNKFEPLIIFKGAKNGKIYKEECRPYNNLEER